MTWYESACATIDAAYKDLSKQFPTMNAAQIMREISRTRYPFGVREHFPYKQWLKAVKDYGKKVGVRPVPMHHRITEGDLFA